MTYYATGKAGGNVKLGMIPYTNSGMDTCPSSCPLNGSGCYAQVHRFIAPAWRKLTAGETKSALGLGGLVDWLERLPKGQLWRHNVAGDLPKAADGSDTIDAGALGAIVQAQKGKRGFTYTHYPLSASNRATIERAIQGGFTINISTESPQQALQAYRQGLPAVTVVTPDFQSCDIEGVRFAVCPAELPESSVTCANCGVCQKADRKSIICFPAHGVSKKKVIQIVNQSI